MEYKFVSREFEGPLDLLLHLIKDNNIDIFNINISDITNQYLSYIEHMESLNLNVDSEYLVMASELIELKSRFLLPHDVEEEIDEDPRESLINRLVLYEKYKQLSSNFKDLERDRMYYYSKVPSLLTEFHDSSVKIDEDLTLSDLLNAFKKFQEKKEFDKSLNTVVTRKEYSVHKRSREIIDRLKGKKSIIFDDLFDIYSKEYVVVTFLAVLDLAKNGKLIIKQDRNLDSIVLSSKGEL